MNFGDREFTILKKMGEHPVMSPDRLIRKHYLSLYLLY